MPLHHSTLQLRVDACAPQMGRRGVLRGTLNKETWLKCRPCRHQATTGFIIIYHLEGERAGTAPPSCTNIPTRDAHEPARNKSGSQSKLTARAAKSRLSDFFSFYSTLAGWARRRRVKRAPAVSTPALAVLPLVPSCKMTPRQTQTSDIILDPLLTITSGEWSLEWNK